MTILGQERFLFDTNAALYFMGNELADVLSRCHSRFSLQNRDHWITIRCHRNCDRILSTTSDEITRCDHCGFSQRIECRSFDKRFRPAKTAWHSSHGTQASMKAIGQSQTRSSVTLIPPLTRN